MKKQWINKSLRIILFTGIGAAVIGTVYFLWKKSQPVVTVYEVVSPKRDTVVTKTVATGNVEPRYEVEIKPQISGIIAELRKEAGQMVKEGEIIATTPISFVRSLTVTIMMLLTPMIPANNVPTPTIQIKMSMPKKALLNVSNCAAKLSAVTACGSVGAIKFCSLMMLLILLITGNICTSGFAATQRK